MEEFTTTPQESGQEVHLLDYLIVLAKNSHIIVFATLMMSVLTLATLFILPNQFTATARILPPQQNLTLSGQLLDTLGVTSSIGGSSGGLSGMASSLLGLKSPGDIYAGMLTGDTITDRIIEQFNLKEVYEQQYLEDARKILRGTSVIEVGKDGLISISVTDEDPQRAAAMANAFTAQLNDLLQQMALADATNQLVFLEKERQQAKENLVRQEEALRSFAEKTSVIQIDAQAKGMIEYIAQMRAAIDAKEVQIKVLRQRATPSNYDLVLMETELKGLKEKLRAAEGQTDQTCLGDVCIATGKVPSLGLEYFRIFREVKYQEALYQGFTKMAELARIDAARNVMVNTIQVVDKATPPDRKSKPKRLILTIIAAIGFGVIMVFVAFVREYYQNAQESPTEKDRLMQLAQYLDPWRQKISKIRVFLRLKKKKAS